MSRNIGILLQARVLHVPNLPPRSLPGPAGWQKKLRHTFKQDREADLGQIF